MLARRLRRSRQLRRPRRRGALAIGLLAAVAGAATWLFATELFPYHSLNHDEGVYLQQAAMLLDGQLALRPPLPAELRPWFFVDDGGRLYPKYSPVAPAAFAIGLALGEPRLSLVAIAAGNVALVAAVVGEAFDRRTGLLAAAFVLASPLFLLQSSVFLAYAPTTLLNLAFAYAYLRADRASGGAQLRWAGLAGAAVGLAFFSRPYTALLFATPFVVHACWTIASDVREATFAETREANSRIASEETSVDWRSVVQSGALRRQSITAAGGLAGVAVALGYNAVQTGSPLRFPYQAFAPEDGLGFGHRRILGHAVEYTPELALRANARVVELFATEWIAGGALGAALAVGGGVHAVRHRRGSAWTWVFLGVAASVVLGNVYFWGNYNVLGSLERPGDGLVAVLGPYYHFDLLVPTAAFAALGARRGASLVWNGAGRVLDGAPDGLPGSRSDGLLGARSGGLPGARSDGRAAHVALVLAVLLPALAAGAAVTAAALDNAVERNAEVTATYEDAYEPFDDGPPARSVVLLPDPYGDWLNHPFQHLRNDPEYDGRAVYAIDDRPFAVLDAFPGRTPYRYAYRGSWAPAAGSPDAAVLRRVRDVRGDAARLDVAVGVPRTAESATVRLGVDDESVYRVPANATGTLNASVVATNQSVRLAGERGDRERPADANGSEPGVNDANASRSGAGLGWLPIDDRETVHLSVFVDYGPRGGFAYRFELPLLAEDGTVRALTPRIRRCRGTHTCGEGGAHVPEAAPEGVFARTSLRATSAPAAAAGHGPERPVEPEQALAADHQ